MAKGGFRGGPLGGGMSAMQQMQQARKMQENLMKMQEELQNAEYSATSGGGAVKATVSGGHRLLALEISKDVCDPEDTEMLADLILAAVNEAQTNAENAASANMSKLTGGLDLSGLL
ncbi:MAG: YbaB/EbfC family nucleoid-associated protein [Oscillospiraceae bacterium]|nr:YbaB/EbfC family nucleoid-associated protein [Oscillospiraceae bacterium]